MNKIILILYWLFFFLISISIHSQNNTNDPIYIGYKMKLKSKILEQEREIQISLPKTYNKNTGVNYPVLYLLDGDIHFHSVTGLVDHMSSGKNSNYQIPEMIIVAISNINFKQRRIELTPTKTNIFPSGNGDKFLSFITNELIPFVDENYRTNPFRLLIGHSLGGLMAIYSYLYNSTYFNAYVAIDSSLWWDNELIIQMTKNKLSSNERQDDKNSIYIAVAENSGVYNTDLGKKLNTEFKEANINGLNTKIEVFKNENHGSVPLIALYKGLSFIFEGYDNTYGTPPNSKDEILNTFNGVSQKIGYDIPPPYEYINRIGDYILYQKKDIQRAIQIYSINNTNYPNEPSFYNKIAKAYTLDEDFLNAKKFYLMTLALDSKNSEAIKALKVVNGNLKN